MTTEQQIADLDLKIAALKAEVKTLTYVLGTLISWLPQSANSPIRQDEAAKLLALLHP